MLSRDPDCNPISYILCLSDIALLFVVVKLADISSWLIDNLYVIGSITQNASVFALLIAT